MRDYSYIKHNGQITRLDFEEIRFIEGCRTYCRVFLDGDRHFLLRRTIKELEGLLPSGKFIRIHKSYLVPLGRISWVSRDWVSLDCRRTLPIGGVFAVSMKELVQENLL
jgi:DNA-binding LytR/AlgR family response regulator